MKYFFIPLYMNQSIGELIRESVKKSGLTQEEFAREMGMTHRNLANLFNKERIPIEQLIRASKILKEDFINQYSSILYNEEPALFGFRDQYLVQEKTKYEKLIHKEKLNQDQEVSVSINVFGLFEQLADEFPEMLRIIKTEAEARGLRLG